jgi:hypothetical protein
MPTLSKLCREFLAAMPVIAPMLFIERELLLAKKKPIAFLDLDTRAGPEPIRKKNEEDIKILDEAVRKGELISVDAAKWGMRLYGQLGQEEAIRAIIEDLEAPYSERKHSMGTLLGYRKRDIIFFNIFRTLPGFANALYLSFMNPCVLAAYNDRELERCEIDPGQWHEKYKGLEYN